MNRRNYLAAGFFGYIISYFLIGFLLPQNTDSMTNYLAFQGIILFFATFVSMLTFEKISHRIERINEAVMTGFVFALFYAAAEGYKYSKMASQACYTTLRNKMQCNYFYIDPNYAFLSFVYAMIIVAIAAILFTELRKKRSFSPGGRRRAHKQRRPHTYKYRL